MRLAWAIALLAALSGGCTRSYYIHSRDSAQFRSFEELAATNACQIVLDNRLDYRAEHVVLAEDSTSWNVVATGATISVPTQRIRTITVESRKQGASGGAVIGLAAAGLLGGAIGWSMGSDGCERGSGYCLSHGSAAGLGAFLLGVPGLVLGAIVGAGHGATFIYYPFPEEKVRASEDTGTEAQEGEPMVQRCAGPVSPIALRSSGK